MEKKCIKITITSESGYFCHEPWTGKLTITSSLISYEYKVHKDKFSNEIKSKLSWKDYLNEEESDKVNDLLEDCSCFHLIPFDSHVCDGSTLDIAFHFDDKSKEHIYLTYGREIDENYMEIYYLLSDISKLVRYHHSRPDYLPKVKKDKFEIQYK